MSLTKKSRIFPNFRRQNVNSEDSDDNDWLQKKRSLVCSYEKQNNMDIWHSFESGFRTELDQITRADQTIRDCWLELKSKFSRETPDHALIFRACVRDTLQDLNVRGHHGVNAGNIQIVSREMHSHLA